MTTTTPVTTTTTPTTTGATTGGGAMQQLSGNFNTFLTLLTTQLKNQDPTSPMDSSTFTQQLVEYSQVEQQIDTNTSLNTLIGQGTSQAGANATTYLGRQVTITNGKASLSGGAATWNYNLGATAANTALSITNAAGTTVYSGAGETASGGHSFTWNGQDNNGNQLADGTYTMSAAAKALDGSAVTTGVSSTGTVSEVDMTGGTPQLVIGNMEVGVGDVMSVANPLALN